MPELRRSLLDYDTEVLRAIAASRGIEASGSRVDLLESLLEDSSRPLAMRLLWEQLGESERKAMRHLASKGGWVRAVYFEHEHGELRHFGGGRLARERLWQQPVNTTERLYFLGLIFRGFEEGAESAIWYIPTDLLPLIPTPTRAPEQHPLKPLALDANVTPSTSASLRHASDFLLRSVFRVTLAARREERPLETAVARRLALERDAPDQERLAYFVSLGLCLARELHFLDGQRLSQKGLGSVRHWLSMPLPQALALVANTWLQASGWHELLNAPGIVFEGGRLPDSAPGRQYLCRILAGLDSGVWYSIGELQANLRDGTPDFLRQDADFGSLYLRDSASGNPLDGIAAWMQVEGRFTDEVLVTLNALDALSLGTQSGQRCFRLEAGSFWLRGEAPRAEDAKPELTILPNLALECAPKSSLYLRYQVEAVAEPGSVANRFHITRSSLVRAQNAGISVARVAAFLRSHANGFGDDDQRALQALLAPPTIHAPLA